MIHAIVCGGSQGKAVVYGECDALPVPGEPYTLRNARMVLRWSTECGGLFGLAASGPKGDTRLTSAVAVVSDEAARQVLSVSADAVAAFAAWPAS